MDQGPLVTEQIDAGAKLAGKFDANYKPLKAAFWFKESDDGQWFLYLVSDQIDDTNFDLAYGEIDRLLGRGPHLWLDPFQIKVTGVDDPVAKAVLLVQQEYPGKLATRLRNRMIGGVYIEEAYVYSMPIAVPG
jgi:hypothetical protein